MMQMQHYCKTGLWLVIVLFFLLCANKGYTETTTIALAGDSITSGYPEVKCAKGIQSYGGYSYYLEQLLDAGGHPSSVLNYGIAGDRAEWATREYDKWCTSKDWAYNNQPIYHNQIQVALEGPEPEYVTYLFGTNDLAYHSPSTVVGYIEAGINAIKAGGATPIVGTILPDTRSKGDVKDIVGANALLRQLLQNKNVQIAEFHDATTENNWENMMSDGIHPDDTGRKFMAEIWYDAILESMQRSNRVVPAVNFLLLNNR